MSRCVLIRHNRHDRQKTKAVRVLQETLTACRFRPLGPDVRDGELAVSAGSPWCLDNFGMSSPKPPKRKTTTIQVRSDPEEREVYNAYAKLRGFKSLSDWLRNLMTHDPISHAKLFKRASDSVK